MTIKQYVAQWYANDEYDQWIESEAFDTLDEAKRAAFKRASRNGTHLICYVDIQELGKYGFETTKELVNHHDFGNRWSGWITQEKYKQQYGCPA